LEEKKLELCIEKTKVLICNRREREKMEIWKWNKKEIKEVQEFKYLGFTLNRWGNCKDHIKELSRVR